MVADHFSTRKIVFSQKVETQRRSIKLSKSTTGFVRGGGAIFLYGSIKLVRKFFRKTFFLPQKIEFSGDMKIMTAGRVWDRWKSTGITRRCTATADGIFN